jgi:hypothetical protein
LARPIDELPTDAPADLPTETPPIEGDTDRRTPELPNEDVADGSLVVDPFDDSQFDLVATDASDHVSANAGDGIDDIVGHEKLDEPSDDSGWADD